MNILKILRNTIKKECNINMVFIGIVADSKEEKNILELLEYNNFINKNNVIFIKEMNIDNIKNVHFDTVIINRRFDKMDELNVILKNAKNIVIIGGGDSGCEVAYMAKYELDKNVTIVEMAPTLMTHTCTANRGHLLHYLDKANVKCYNCTTVIAINEDNVELLVNASKTVPNPYTTWEPVLPENVHNPLAKKIKNSPKAVNVEADLVILAAGTVPNNELFKKCQEINASPIIYNVGDSFKCGKVFTAVKSAFNVAKNL